MQRNRNQGAILQSKRRSDSDAYPRHDISNYGTRVSEAERIYLRLSSGAANDAQTRARAERMATINALLRPRRFSWEVDT